jgi:hypothetical protein
MPNLVRTGADAMEPQQRDQRGQAGVLPSLFAVPSVHVVNAIAIMRDNLVMCCPAVLLTYYMPCPLPGPGRPHLPLAGPRAG